MRTAFDAVIVGAGPAGATAAILLARAGWSVALVEKQEFPRRKVCGECIAASNFALLESLGLFDCVGRYAGPELRQVALMLADRTVVAQLPAADDGAHPWGRALGRETLDTLLLEEARLAGAYIWQPWSIDAIEGKPGAFVCHARGKSSRDSARLQAAVAITAQGSWESQRGSRRARRPSDLFAFKAQYEGAELGAGILPVLSFRGGYGGMVIADGGIATVACCVRADRLAELRRAQPARSAGEAVGEMLQQECRGVAIALRSAHRRGAWLACGPLDPGIHLRSDDTVLRIGNAAAEAHPIIGEGMSMAMQSAWLLCTHLLAEGPRGSQAQATQQQIALRYAREWRRHFAWRLRFAAVFAHLAMRPRLVAPLLPLVNIADVLSKGAKLSGKTRCAIDSATAARLVAGMRSRTMSVPRVADSSREVS